MNWKKIITNPFVLAFVMGIVCLHLVREISLKRKRAPAPMVVVNDWRLVDQNGQSFGKTNLLGKLVVADFFFTSCPTICPKLTHAMKEVYQRFLKQAHNIEFVSISVDPEHDRPEVLRKYMADNGLEVANWHCLTGSKQEIYDVVVGNMRVHVGEKEAPKAAHGVYDIPHLAQLALFDQNGDLRALFNTDNSGLASLVSAANFLLEKP